MEEERERVRVKEQVVCKSLVNSKTGSPSPPLCTLLLSTSGGQVLALIVKVKKESDSTSWFLHLNISGQLLALFKK